MTAKATKAAKPEKKVVDWDAMEPHYRAGLRSLEDLGKEYGCSGPAILKHAKKHNWERDLSKRIAAKAEAKVKAAAVSEEVKAQKAANQEQVIEANAELQYRIRMEHRKDIGRSRSLFQKLLKELEQLTDHLDLYQEIADLYDESGPDANGRWKTDKANELYRKIISLSGRVTNGKQLVEMLEKLVKMEREAFGIKTDEEKSPLDELLIKIAREREQQA